MPKVLLLVSFAGDGFVWDAGSVIEVDDVTAQRMFAAGFAQLAEDASPESVAETPEGRATKGKRVTRYSAKS